MKTTSKRILAVLLSTIILISLSSLPVSGSDIEESGFCGGNVSYTLDSDGVLTISGSGDMADYGIIGGTDPDGNEWHEGENSPFYNNESIKKVIVEHGITSIGDGIFEECTKISSVTIPNSVTSIGKSSFYHCCGITNITIPDSVISIDDNAFISTRLTEITIPDSVKSIGGMAFSYTDITSLIIGEGLDSLDGSAFNGCYQLEKIEVSIENRKYHSVRNCIIETESKTLVVGCKNSIIPDDGSVTSIGDDAFSNKGITSITIPYGVTSIGFAAFFGCIDITSINIPDSVTYIGDQAFDDCIGLASVTIPQSVTAIGDDAFPKNTIIIGAAGSYAEQWAKENDRTFKSDSEDKTDTNKVIIGDINSDGDILADDARLALRASAKLEILSDTQLLAADVNEDKQVLADDARQILRYSAKLQHSFEKTGDDAKPSESINLELNKDSFIFDEEKQAYLPKDTDNAITGTVNATIVKSLTFEICDDHGLLISQGEIKAKNNWSIEKYSFIDGLNTLKIIASPETGEDEIITVSVYSPFFVNPEAAAIDLSDDSDSDGLPDYLEAYYNTDSNENDTDGDGLSDYIELNDIGTSPLEKDSNNNNITDDQEDFDGDGLKNIEEVEVGTSLVLIDTDSDSLSDFVEISIHKTNPLDPDTDKDGVSDGDEVEIGSDPLQAETSFTTEASYGAVDGNSDIAVSVSMISGSANANDLTIQEIGPSDSFMVSNTIPGYLGSAYDISSSSEFESATLTFTYNMDAYRNLEDFEPRIYYVNEETQQLEELPDQIVQDGSVSVTITHFSTYILLNKIEFDKVWATEIRQPYDNASGIHSGLDMMLLIDCSASMGPQGANNDPDNIRLDVSKKLVEKSDDIDRFSIISFGAEINLLTDFTSDKTVAYEAINSVGNTDNHTYINKALTYAFDVFTNSSRDDSIKYLILLTDGKSSDSVQIDYETEAKNKDITIFTIGLGTWLDVDLLQSIAHTTGGKYYHATRANDLYEIYEEIEDETIDFTTDSNNDGISDYYTQLIDEGTLRLGNGAVDLIGIKSLYDEDSDDWDADGLLNGEEIEVVGDGEKVYLRYHSDPLNPDTDFDGYDDYYEVKTINTSPVKKTVDAGLLKDALNDSVFYSPGMADKYDNWFNEITLHVFDWQKTDQATDKLISYFYNYASEASLTKNADSIKKQEQREKLNEYIGNAVNIIIGLKNMTDAATEIGSDPSELTKQSEKLKTARKKAVKAQSAGDPEKGMNILCDALSDANSFADLLESNGTETFKIGTDVFAGTVSLIRSVNSKIQIPLGSTLTSFANSYQSWMNAPAFQVGGKGVPNSALVNVGLDIAELELVEIPKLYNTYSKILANTDAFEEYIEIVEHIAHNGNGEEVMRRAGEKVLNIVLNKSAGFYQEFFAATRKKRVQQFIDSTLDIVGEVWPYIKVVKTTYEMSMSITGLTDECKYLICNLMNDSIKDGCVSCLLNNISLVNNYFEYENSDVIVEKYLLQLYQSRIDAENTYYLFINIKGLGTWIGKLFTGDDSEAVKGKIKYLYESAVIYKLSLSSALPFYNEYSGSGGGGMGSR